MSKPEDLVMMGRAPLMPRLQEIDIVARLKSLGLVKEESDQPIVQSIIFKEAIMAKALQVPQPEGIVLKGASKSNFEFHFKRCINLLKTASGLFVPDYCLEKEQEVVAAVPQKQATEVAVTIVMPSTLEKVPAAAPVVAAPVIQEEVVHVVKAAPYDWQAFRNKWLPSLAFLLVLIGLIWLIMYAWAHKPVAAPVQQVQQQMQPGENPVTSMPEIMVTNNSTVPLPVWIDNDTKPRMTLKPGDSLHVKHRNGERTRVKVGETEQIFTFEGMPLVQHMAVDK